MTIITKTRFRSFNFTLYERLDTFYSQITQLFNKKSCSFALLNFQFEPNQRSEEPGRYHAQGYVKIRKQMALGSYNSKTKKGSSIKEIFQANPHIEHANRTEQQYLDYCSKDFNHCKNPLHNPNPKKGKKCKCDFFDLTKKCKFCNKNCKRLFARIGKDPNIAGPFLFIYDESKYKNQKEDNDNDDDAYLEAISNILNEKDVNETIVKFAPKLILEQRELIDENGKGDIIHIFEKGNKKEFNERIFDIEFNKGTTLEEVEKVTVDLGIEGEIYQDVKTGLFYWKQSWNNIINKYSIIEDIDDKTDRVVTNIPKSDPGERILVSSSKKRKKNQTYQDPQEESSKTEKSLQNIEKNLKRKLLNNSLISKNIISESSKKRKLLIIESESNNSIEYDFSVSNYHSEDSNYTKDLKRQTKINGKRKIENSDKNNNTQQEKQQKFNNTNTIDTEQIQIQQFYQKSLEAKKNIVENNNDDFDICEDIELDISKETTYEEFNRKNKNNSLYLGFKSICKKI
ncbi:hypothetical protein F8M41_017304 [Gigaspora margarita]|uniref:CRESS-DNA virus Rep endonuclease domain-containing protein n=1 Tax=Gigaspora margarita TaxID=4874 RepID=A0A8H4EM75_GIGMA|nr:hypothetical protein F8M41_017304 [Gigaspora margarita]